MKSIHHRTCVLPLLGAALLGAAAEGQAIQNELVQIRASDGEALDDYASGISLDGNRLLVGAGRADLGVSTTTNEGAAYVHEWNGSAWVETQILTAPDVGVGSEFGADVELRGDQAFIGARLYDVTVGGNEGAVYVFDYDGATWSESDKLLASDGLPGDNFGISISNDGEWLAIGAQNDDMVGGSGGEGSVYLYRLVSGTWTFFQKLEESIPLGGAGFGNSIWLRGTRLAVGSNHALGGIPGEDWGSVSVFDFNGTTWLESDRILPGDGEDGGHFGRSVAFEGDRMVIGAHESSAVGGGPADAGRVYFLEYDGADWNETAELSASDLAVGDQLGYDCDIEGDFVVVGARNDDETGANQGSAYIFRHDGSTWIEVAKLINSNGGAADQAGREVELDGGRVIVAAGTASNDATLATLGQATEFDLYANAPAASVAVYNGAGTNALVYSTADLPILGQTFSTSIDVTLHPGTTFTYVIATLEKLDPGVPLLGEELLIKIEAFGGVTVASQLGVPSGGVSSHPFPIPDDAGLAGIGAAAQGLIFGGGVELVNALELVLGYP